MYFQKTKYFYRPLSYWMFGVIASLTVISIVGIFVFLLIGSIGAFQKISVRDFLGTNWNPTAFHVPTWGILSLILSTVMISILALFIAVPFGLSIAVYLSEIASPKTREILKPLIEMIASIPSVVLGLLGILFLSPLIAKIFHLSNGLNALTASLMISIVALPTIASICEDALSSVPFKLREASLAVGATKLTTIRKVVVPACAPGLVGAIMLGLGRVVGETMIVLMVAGNSRALPQSFLDPVRPMTANIAIEIKEVVMGSLHWQTLFAIGFILFLMTFALNFLADMLIYKKSLL